jgi:adenosylcobinamide-phosphate synthase
MSLAPLFLTFALQTVLGLLWDRAVGDPPAWPHPARWVGRLITGLERALRARLRHLRAAGALLTAMTVGLAAAAAALLLLALALLDALLLPAGTALYGGGPATWPWASLLGGGLLCGVWFSFRSLGEEAAAIHRLLDEGRLAEARTALGYIVGRDTASLDEPAVARAVVETVAENSVDGGLAPVLWALLGGPVLCTAYKAASTLDSMVGYRNETYRDLGAASARLDDALAWLPARLALVAVPLAAAPGGTAAAARSLRIGRRDGRKHPSPNAAIGESLFAGALGVQLGGPATYDGLPSEKPRLGDPDRPLARGIIGEAAALLRRLWAVALLAAALWAGGLLLAGAG